MAEELRDGIEDKKIKGVVNYIGAGLGAIGTLILGKKKSKPDIYGDQGRIFTDEKNELKDDKRDKENRKIISRIVLGEKSKNGKAFLVKESQRVLFLQNGALQDTVKPGLWLIDPKFDNPGSELIWVSTIPFKFKWGVPNIELRTKEYAKVGCSGSSIWCVKDPRALFMNVSTESEGGMHEDNIKSYIKDNLRSVIKHIFGTYTVEQLRTGRSEFEAHVRAEMHDLLEKWGLRIDNFEVSKFIFPKEFEQMFDDRMTDSVNTARSDLDDKLLQHEAKSNLREQELSLLKTKRMQEIKVEKNKYEVDSNLETQKASLTSQTDLDMHSMKLDNVKIQSEMENMLATQQKTQLNTQIEIGQMKLEQQKMELEMMKQKQQAQLDQMRLEMDMQQQQHAAQIAKLQKQSEVNGRIADIDVNEIDQLSQAKVREKNVEIDKAEHDYKDSDFKLEKMRLESNIDKDRMSSNERIQLKRLDSERSIEVARANADTNQNARIVSQQENQVNQKHEESMNQMQLNRDIEVAKATGQGGTHIEYGTSNKGVNSTRVAKLEQDILNLRSDLKTLDQLQLEGKLTADMYSVRSKDLLKEIELLQIEQSALRNV